MAVHRIAVRNDLILNVRLDIRAIRQQDPIEKVLQHEFRLAEMAQEERMLADDEPLIFEDLMQYIRNFLVAWEYHEAIYYRRTMQSLMERQALMTRVSNFSCT